VLTKDPATLYTFGQAIQVDAAFAYAIADPALTDSVLRQRAVAGLEAQARKGQAYADGNAFDIVCSDKWRPMFMGFFSTPWDGRVALRAYHLTRKPEYLALGLRAAQFSSGANPDNLTFTTGVGSNPIRLPLHLDSHTTGQPAPEGITVYGIEDHVNFPQTWSHWIVKMLDLVMSPGYLKWPVTESYTDVGLFVAVTEFTVDMWDESVWTWGYLAARPLAR
jgi:endoglucanase